MTIFEVFRQTDWKLLAQQKEVLVGAANMAGPTVVKEHLEGVVNWIDQIQDAAAEEGYPVFEELRQ